MTDVHLSEWIDVHAAGVAFPDALQSRGLYQYKPELPYTPGAEIAGVVRSAPDGAHVSAGDRVCGLTMLCGAMAEVVALQPERVQGRVEVGVQAPEDGLHVSVFRLQPMTE